VENVLSRSRKGNTRSERNYVKSNENSSDVLSRGCTPSELKNNYLWLSGPEWLQNSGIKWSELSDSNKQNTLTKCVCDGVKGTMSDSNSNDMLELCILFLIDR